MLCDVGMQVCRYVGRYVCRYVGVLVKCPSSWIFVCQAICSPQRATRPQQYTLSLVAYFTLRDNSFQLSGSSAWCREDGCSEWYCTTVSYRWRSTFFSSTMVKRL